MHHTFSSYIIPYVYAAIAIIEIVAATLGYQLGVYLLKPLLMPVLLIWTFYGYTTNPSGGKWLRIGLLWACLGDILLMFKGGFLYGLGAFLVMQICYIIAFLKQYRRTPITPSQIGVLTLVIIVITILLKSLYPNLEEGTLQLPVSLYAVTIGFMACAASFRSVNVSKASYAWVLLGAFLFVLSDALIAWNSFVSSISYAPFYIMTTYVLAQYIIVRGYYKL